MNISRPVFSGRVSTMADSHHHSEQPISRRRMLGVVGATLGLSGLGMLRHGIAGAELGSSQLNRAGEALEPAVRVPATTTTIPDPNAATTTDVTTTTEVSTDATTTTTTTVPLADGEIRFPIIVGEDDDCFVLDNFGDCRGSGCSRSHEGVDIMADEMLPVIAPAAGRLTKRYVDYGSLVGAGNGWTLVDEEAEITYKFFHLDSHADDLEVDDLVEAGQIIGYVGNTGTSGATSGTNYHLHFEYRPDNVAADSYELLQRVPFVEWETEPSS